MIYMFVYLFQWHQHRTACTPGFSYSSQASKPNRQRGGLVQKPSQKVGWDKQIWQPAPGQALTCSEGRESKEELRAKKAGEERQGEGREGSVTVSLSPEHRCLCQPQQLRSTFCCDRVFSAIDPNYRSQPTWTESVTSISPAAARAANTVAQIHTK